MSPAPGPGTNASNGDAADALLRAWNSLPMRKRYPILAGAAFGVVLRVMFSGEGGSPWSAMVGALHLRSTDARRYVDCVSSGTPAPAQLE